MNIFESVEALQAVGIRDWLSRVADLISVSGTHEHLYLLSNEDLGKLARALQTSLEKTGHAIYPIDSDVSVYGETIRDASGLIHHTDAHLFRAPLSGDTCLKVVSYHHFPGKEAVAQKPFIAFFYHHKSLSSISRSPLN